MKSSNNQQLEAIQISDVINSKTKREDINRIFREVLEEAALKAKVPQHNKRGIRANTEQLKKMLSERAALHQQLQEEDIRNTDKEVIEKRIEQLNREILENKQAQEEKEEKKAIERIKDDNFKAFFRLIGRRN